MNTEQPEISQEAARAMLAVLRTLLSVFPDPILSRGRRLRIDEVAELNFIIEAGSAAIAQAEAR